jgi:hypothetical protein
MTSLTSNGGLMLDTIVVFLFLLTDPCSGHINLFGNFFFFFSPPLPFLPAPALPPRPLSKCPCRCYTHQTNSANYAWTRHPVWLKPQAIRFSSPANVDHGLVSFACVSRTHRARRESNFANPSRRPTGPSNGRHQGARPPGQHVQMLVAKFICPMGHPTSSFVVEATTTREEHKVCRANFGEHTA